MNWEAHTVPKVQYVVVRLEDFYEKQQIYWLAIRNDRQLNRNY
jgi:hypothetical protein